MTKKRKAVSPVIATVVLVAVAITIAVAVSYWMSGISSQYTQFEKVEVTGAYCKSGEGNWRADESSAVTPYSCWNITLDFRNTGTTEATIIGCSVSSIAIADYGTFYDGSNATRDFLNHHMRAYKENVSDVNRLDFAETQGGSYPIKYTVLSGETGKIILSIIEEPDDNAYSFSSGTTIEVALRSGAGNTYMKMITLS